MAEISYLSSAGVRVGHALCSAHGRDFWAATPAPLKDTAIIKDLASEAVYE